MVRGCEKDLLVAEAGISGEKSPWSHGSLREQGWGVRSGGGCPVSTVPGERGQGGRVEDELDLESEEGRRR